MMAAATFAQARLGWTLEQCQNLWGAPVQVQTAGLMTTYDQAKMMATVFALVGVSMIAPMKARAAWGGDDPNKEEDPQTEYAASKEQSAFDIPGAAETPAQKPGPSGEAGDSWSPEEQADVSVENRWK